MMCIIYYKVCFIVYGVYAVDPLTVGRYIIWYILYIIF